MIRAAIFDMDGTMVNSERLWGNVGLSLAAFKEYFRLSDSVDELVRIRRDMILAEDTSLTRVNPGLHELLDLLDHLKIKKAVATSSFREFTKKILSGFDLEKRFDAIITGDDVTLGKPDPAIFLEAAKILGAPAKECLVLEDAENGVEAAYRAGMHVFAIPHDDGSRHHDFSKATGTLGSMMEISEEILMGL